MKIEKRCMEAIGTADGKVMGHITLDSLAYPETVKVTLLGETLIPVSFNSCGHPNFTQEQLTLYRFKEKEIERKNGGKYIELEAEVVYQERTFDVPRNTFDTVKGIKKSLHNLSDLNKVLQNRSLFCRVHKDKRLSEFVLFGQFWLDQFGQIMSNEKSAKDKLVSSGDVERYETFRSNNGKKGFVWTSGGYAIPTEEAVCPCCGKKFTIEDIKNNPCVYEEGKFYHDSCWRNYRKIVEIDKLTRQLMDIVYKETDYHFELLPNGYCNRECCSHIPWILFHTIDGDIIIGWRKRVISIEWQENYKPFDMKKLFEAEDVTKWNEGGKRGIHAWGNDKAYEYLTKVLEVVNPGYSKW